MPPVPPGTPRLDLTTRGGRLRASLENLARRVTFQPQPPAPPVQEYLSSEAQQATGAAGAVDPATVTQEMALVRQQPASDYLAINQSPTGTARPPSSILGQVGFGPLEPLSPRYPPGTPEADGGPRMFQYPVGVNIQTTPRAEYSELAPFYQLKNLASAYDVIQLCIAARVEEMQGMGHAVVANDKRRQKELQDVCDEVETFFHKPDGVQHFDQWIAALVREHLTTDAVTLFPHLNRGGELYALEQIDGATIKPLLDDRGRVMAYQQIMFGYPFTEYKTPDEEDRGPQDFPTWSTQDLLYLPRFTSNWYPYGSPPTEWIIMRVNQAIRKQTFDIAYFTDGNIPDMIATVPPGSITADQLAQFEILFNAMLEGNDQARRKMRFIPYGADIKELRPFSYETVLDEWMLRITCAAMAVPPQELGFTQDVNRATAELQEAVNERRGLKPLSTWVKNAALDDVIHNKFGNRIGTRAQTISAPGMPTRKPTNPFKLIGWQWQYGDKSDKAQEAQTDQIYLDKGVVSTDEIRSMRFGEELEGPSPATLKSQAQLAAAQSAAPADGGKYPITITPVAGAQATPPIDDQPRHQPQDMPLPMEAIATMAWPSLKKEMSWNRAYVEAELLHNLDGALHRQHAAIRKGQGNPLEIMEFTHLAMLDWLKKAIYASAPAEFLTQLDYDQLHRHASSFLLAKREAAIAYGLEPLSGILRKEADPELVISETAGSIAGIWAGLLENAPLIAAWDLLHKADPGVGHMTMQPPKHINCRCKLRVRKVLLVHASPAPRTQAEQPTVAEQEKERQPALTPDEPQAGMAGDDMRDQQHAQQQQDDQARNTPPRSWAERGDQAQRDREAAENRPAPEEGDPEMEGLYFAAPASLRKGDGSAWVAYWLTMLDERTCKKPFATPWGGTVAGCIGLNGLVVTSGPLLGHSIESVRAA